VELSSEFDPDYQVRRDNEDLLAEKPPFGRHLYAITLP
jgi:hypothetical protein